MRRNRRMELSTPAPRAKKRLPIPPEDQLLIDLGLPFRIEFDRRPSPEEMDRLLDLEGAQTRRILTARYGLGGGSPLTQEEVGVREGCSRQYIQQLEDRWRRLAVRLIRFWF
jgi:Sigma-70, region 4